MNENDWINTFDRMDAIAGEGSWRDGQDDTIRFVSGRLRRQTGVLIADEVGMGKTRVALCAVLAVLENGGSVAVVVPPGLLSQWKKEWDDFLHTRKGEERYFPAVLRSYNSLFEDPHLSYPLAQNKGTWLLISHRFGLPRIQAGESRSSGLGRYMLPMLAAAIRSINDKERRNKFRELLKQEGRWKKCLEESCDNCDYKEKKCGGNFQVKRAAEFLANKYWGKFRNLDDIRDVRKAQIYYKKKTDEVRQMIAALLGQVDLLVIDEAHKSRDIDEPQTQLGILLQYIVKLKEGARRIALTATPIGMAAIQWKTIFERIGEAEQFPGEVIREFTEACTKANKSPDNRDIMKNLILKSEAFCNKLKPFVTRRRRNKQEDFIKLIGSAPCEASAHPHHNPVSIDIRFGDSGVDETWRPAVFGLEALGKVAKGLTIENGDAELNNLLRKLKIMDSRYAAGQISKDEAISDQEGEDTDQLESKSDEFTLLSRKLADWLENDKQCDQMVRGKMNRIRYWLNRVRGIGRDLSGHPRVKGMADAIERQVWGEDGEIKEKVLVFGTFVGPLRALRDVVNRRAVLRILNRKPADGKEPTLPGAGACLKEIDRIWEEYGRIKGSLVIREEFVRGLQSKEELAEIIGNAGTAYKNLREKEVEKYITEEKFVATLPGDQTIQRDNLAGDVVDFLRSRLINDMIYGNAEMRIAGGNIEMRALEIWAEFLSSFLDTEDGNGRTAKTEWKAPDYFSEGKSKLIKMQMLDREADNMGAKLVAPLREELKNTSKRFGSFARMLYGEVKMESRRILQAQFNNKKSFPVVLIAQSQVGREGLNLHKACRIVMQFHTEWNPEATEQQIGRVDRIGSFWEEKARAWREERGAVFDSNPKYDGPKIEIMPIVFEGTYDAFQYGVSKRRQEILRAHLFGELLNEIALGNLMKKSDDEWIKLRQDLMKAVPDFSPRLETSCNALNVRPKE